MSRIFRCREFASQGPACEAYQNVKSLLPSEHVCYAQFRDSKAARHLHRFKAIPGLFGDESHLEACYLGIATSWWRKFKNDSSGSELLSAGVFLSLLELRSVREFLPGDPMASFAAGLRRTTEYLKSAQTLKRPTKCDRINVSDGVLFDSLWYEAETTQLFLKTLGSYESSDQVPEAMKKQLAERAICYANRRLDMIDQKVFGGIVPHVPYVFDKLFDFWQVHGIEWLVAREALVEFRPDNLLC